MDRRILIICQDRGGEIRRNMTVNRNSKTKEKEEKIKWNATLHKETKIERSNYKDLRNIYSKLLLNTITDYFRTSYWRLESFRQLNAGQNALDDYSRSRTTLDISQSRKAHISGKVDEFQLNHTRPFKGSRMGPFSGDFQKGGDS